MSEAIDALKKIICLSAVSETPFPHIVINSFLPQWFAQEISHYYYENNKGLDKFLNSEIVLGYANPERFVIEIEESTNEPIIKKLNALFSSRDIYESIARKFEISINSDSVAFRGQVTRDTNQYALGIHTDHPSKIFTIIVYLTPGKVDEIPGTTLYESKFGFTSSGLAMYYQDFKYITEATTVPHKFNTALIFARSDTSFHGVKNIQNQNPRLTLQLNYFKNSIDLKKSNLI